MAKFYVYNVDADMTESKRDLKISMGSLPSEARSLDNEVLLKGPS